MAFTDVFVSMLWGMILSVLQLIVSLSLATGCVYLGIRMFDRSTKDIDEIKELKKGNVAVAILMATVVYSIANVVQIGVENLTSLVNPSQSLNVIMVALLIGVLQLFISLAAGIFAILLAIRVLEKITVDIDEAKELKKGNVAIAILMAGVLFSVSFVIRAGVAGLIQSVDPALIAFQLGL